MITWLASYPRSGNTLLRTVLNSTFGLTSYSLYDDLSDIAQDEELRDAVGHKSHGLTQQHFYESARTSSETFFVKTHDAPPDDSKAIYVIRDGRSAVVSYFHYFKNFTQADVTLQDVIAGACNYGSWSNHVDEWEPQTRANTLLLRFEDLVLQPSKEIDKIAQFIGIPPINYNTPEFSSMNAVNPKFFRGGSDSKNIDELISPDLELFWLLHNQTMKIMGYGFQKPELSTAFAKELMAKLSGLRSASYRIADLENRCCQFREESLQYQAECRQLASQISDIQKTRWWRAGRKLRLA
jgi:Sulfotransferase domain